MNYFLAQPMLLVLLPLYGILPVVHARQQPYYLRPLLQRFLLLLFQQVKSMCLGILPPAGMDHQLPITYTDVLALDVQQLNILTGAIRQAIQAQVSRVIQHMDIEFEHTMVVHHFLIILFLLMQQLLPALSPSPLQLQLQTSLRILR